MAKEDEMILVVGQEHLPPVSNGILIPDPGNLEALVRQHGFFMRRGTASALPDAHPQGNAESDLRVKQIIPYMTYTYTDPDGLARYFLMHRGQGDSADVRLRGKHSLGIGGHVNRADLNAIGWPGIARRELEEETENFGSFKMNVLGLINDDTTEVNKYHLGYAMLLRGDSPDIRIRQDNAEGPEHIAGDLLTLAEMEPYHDRMESWTQIVYNHLVREAQKSSLITTPRRNLAEFLQNPFIS